MPVELFSTPRANTLKYYNGTAWVNLDGTGNVDSVTATNGLENTGSSSAVVIEPKYSSGSNIVLSAGLYSGTVSASGNILISGASTGTDVDYVTVANLASTINGLLAITFAGDTGDSGDIGDGDTLTLSGGTYITTTGSTGDISIAHDSTSS